ncbi:Lsr2 family protein [Streptomyces sp. PAM3C]|uniref:Lsr2 family protein n=1 Tax=Streptomyces sp. PAM3C TaxID=2847300 RepID=UPI001C1E06F7|nr:Lsr2 family protein [Streptomyces sp. PAM3C]MBU5946764.1 Lsr2 family protein [Streptomyces sp. PAM3C]
MTIAALHQVLDEIDSQGGPAAARAGRLDIPTPKPVTPAAEVRAWAAASGIDCPPAGPVPHRVLKAWHAAHRPAPHTRRAR